MYCETIEMRVRSSQSIGAQILLATSSWNVSVRDVRPNAHGPLLNDICRNNLQAVSGEGTAVERPTE